MTATAPQLRTLATEARRASAELSALSAAERARGIERAAQMLLDAGTQQGTSVRARLIASTGLTAQVIEHGLRTTLSLFEREALGRLLGPVTAPERARLVSVVLAGNVFSAAARPLLLPLLCGAGVVAKAASADDALPHALADALRAADPRLGRACAMATFSHEQIQLLDALLEGADAVSIYGSDATIDAVTARAPRAARVLAHGHGLAAIAIAREALSGDAAALELARRAALDVAAYDQRGCLSPHFVLVEAGGGVSARAFARLLAEALDALEPALPRGTLPEAAAAEQLQWRGVAAAAGELHTTARAAVSYEANGPLRTSPGYRNLAVYECPDLETLRARLAPLGAHLKALGTAGPRAFQALSALAPYVCELGAMQTPPLEACLDGLSPLAGLRPVP